VLNIKGKKLVKLLKTTISLILLTVAFWNQPVYQKYKVVSDKLIKGLRIVQLSDLHSARYGKNQKRLLKMIDKAKPDIIVLTGDIIDDKFSEENAFDLIDGLVSDYPVYYVTGNHEYRHKNPRWIYETLTNKGVHVLMDEYEEVTVNEEQIIIAGIKDPDRNVFANERDLIQESFEDTNLRNNKQVIDDRTFVLLLSHRPEMKDIYETFPIDLVLCGHAHGGQVRIPYLINGLYAPEQGIFPKYAGGQYKFDDCQMIVSRGLSFYIHMPRIFNPPEVVVIDLVAE